MVIGGLLTGGYVFNVLAARDDAGRRCPLVPRVPVPRYREAVVLGLAVLSFTLGFVALSPVNVVAIGRGVVP